MGVQWDTTKHGESIEFLDENLTKNWVPMIFTNRNADFRVSSWD